jgi:hypothetical protein
MKRPWSPAVPKRTENPYLHTYSTSVGMVTPDARGEVFRILKEVRSIVAGMLSIIFTMIVWSWTMPLSSAP